jgi:tripartite-type tricarboxylate transporter receptor subunit TctC
MRLLALMLLAAASGASQAQAWPSKPIRIICPFPPGGIADIYSRLIAQRLGDVWGQPVVVENRSGAGGNIGAEAAARAAPDGYTLVMGNIGTHAASVGLYPKLPYNPSSDFEPIMVIATTPMVLVVKKDLPVSTLSDVIALAKQRRITQGNAGTGSASHLTTLLFTSIAHVDVQLVPYRGLSQAMNDLLAGQIETMFDQVISSSPHIVNGGVKPIAVTSPTRAKAIPNVPTTIEAGLPDLQTLTWTALFAPKGTPEPIIAQLNAAVDKAMNDPAIAKRLAELGADVPAPGEERTPQALRKLVAAELAKWVPLIRAAGVSIE